MNDNNENKVLDAEALNKAQKLLEVIQEGDATSACEIIRELSNRREDSLFHMIGRLTRQLHNSLNNFHENTSLADVTDRELPDARARLDYIIEKTESAANNTMDNIDATIPIANALATDSKNLHDEWSRLLNREMNADEFRELYKSMMQFLKETQTQSEIIHENLTNVLMEQSYQDLTGQMIRRVTDLITAVEVGLVDLIKVAAEAEGVMPSMKEEGAALKEQLVGAKNDNSIKAEGPQLDKEKSGVVKNQDDVDDLLSSLGF